MRCFGHGHYMNAPSPAQPQAKLVAFVSVFHLLRFFSGFFENREQLMLRQQETTLRKLKTVKKNNVQHHATQSCGCCCGATDAHRVFKGLNTAQASAPDSRADVQAESESVLQGRAGWAKGPRDISQFLLIIRLGRNLNGCFFTVHFFYYDTLLAGHQLDIYSSGR